MIFVTANVLQNWVEKSNWNVYYKLFWKFRIDNQWIKEMNYKLF